MGRPVPPSTPQLTHRFEYIPPVTVALPSAAAPASSSAAEVPLAVAEPGQGSRADAGKLQGGGGATLKPTAAALPHELPQQGFVTVQMAAVEQAAVTDANRA